MLSCSERELDWTVSKRCTITFLILNGFEHHLVSRAATTQNKVDPCRSSSSVAHVTFLHIHIFICSIYIYRCRKLCFLIPRLSSVARGTYPRERYHGAIPMLQGMRSTVQ